MLLQTLNAIILMTKINSTTQSLLCNIEIISLFNFINSPMVNIFLEKDLFIFQNFFRKHDQVEL